ncbi:MAG: hypothetical protein H7Z37_06605, partial [Pyrinomonadaceae bacterium]|nr:hypothetical protein [Pyrinomonadaceae bacterium]
MNQPDIFANYEVNNNNWYSNIIKILAVVIPIYLIPILAVAYVPTIRDTVYVAFLFADTKNDWVNKEYKKTQIETATVIDLASDNFRYPEGYFSTEEYAQDEFVSMQQNTTDFGSTGFSTTLPQPDMMPTFDPNASFANPINPTPPVYTPPTTSTYKPPRTPKQPRIPRTPRTPKAKSPDVLAGMLPKTTNKLPEELTVPQTLTPNANTSAETKPTKNPTPKKTATPNQTTTAQNTPGNETTGNSLTDVELNRKPLVDYGQRVEQLQKDKKVDLTKPFHIIIEGELSKDGKLLNAKSTPISGDAALNALATELIGVMNDSNILSYLKALTKDAPKGRRIKFDVSQDDKELKALVTTETESDVKANKLSSGMNGLIFSGKMLRPANQGKVEGVILEQVKVTSSGNQVLINFGMDKEKVTKLIQDQLAAAAKQQSTQP